MYVYDAAYNNDVCGFIVLEAAHIHVCVYMHMYVCTYICIYMYVYICICMYVYADSAYSRQDIHVYMVHIHVHGMSPANTSSLYSHTHTHTHTRTHTHTHQDANAKRFPEFDLIKHAIYTHTYIHTYINTYIHAYIHTYIHTAGSSRRPTYLRAQIYVKMRQGEEWPNLTPSNTLWRYIWTP